MKKSLVIACQSCGYLIKDIANAYVYGGYDVAIITSRESLDSIRSTLSEEVSTMTVIAYDKSSTIKRLYTWLISAIQIYFKLLFYHKGSKVLYVSNPPFGPLLPFFLKNRFSVLIWDIYPDVLVSQKILSEGHFIVRWWRNANRKVYQQAEWVYTISEGMKDCLGQYVGKNKIKVIPLWPDQNNLQKIKKESNLFIRNNHLDGKFVVMYSGNLGNTHRMDVLVDVAKNIKDGDIVFVLIGEGGKKKAIKERIESEDIPNVLLFPYQPYDFLSHSLSAADIAVVTLDTASSRMSVPSKTFNLMSLGQPLMCIASPESELGAFVREYEVGEIFIPGDIEGIAEFVMRLKKNKDVFQKYSQNSLNASKHFSAENAKLFVSS